MNGEILMSATIRSIKEVIYCISCCNKKWGGNEYFVSITAEDDPKHTGCFFTGFFRGRIGWDIKGTVFLLVEKWHVVIDFLHRLSTDTFKKLPEAAHTGFGDDALF